MRFVALAREAVDPAVFAAPPLAAWSEFSTLLHGPAWPALAQIEGLRESAQKDAGVPLPRFVAQTPALLRDGLHYERRIAERGEIATRERNWHDLLNAMIWLRYPQLKSALNARQCAEIARVGARERSRAQCALTHFDEAGIVVAVRDAALVELWHAHDWHGLFWRERAAWHDGRIAIEVFGHALLEHALVPGQLLVGKALAIALPQSIEVEKAAAPGATTAARNIPGVPAAALERLAQAIRAGALLDDPQELRPLPLSGIPRWHRDNADDAFYATAPCFRSRRADRRYPPPFSIGPS